MKPDHRNGLLLLLLLVCGGGANVPAAPRVTFNSNHLSVDGKPFFFYGCWGTPNRDFAEFRRRHFNTAFMGWSTAVKDGEKAANAGLMVIPYPYATGWSNRMKKAVVDLAGKDWILAWNIGDDLRTPEHLAAAVRVQNLIREIDPQRRPVMFDAIGMYEDFARIPDMWCAYAYPLVKPAVLPTGNGKPGGLSQYGTWLRRQRQLGRSDGFFWTWAQCHVQIPYSRKYLGGTDKNQWPPSRFPDGDHLRLIAGHAISSGVRGLMWFVYYYFQDDHFGRDRYAAASRIGCELDLLGPLLAQGRPAEPLPASNPAVLVTPIDFPGGRLLCLVRTGKGFHYQPDAAVAEKVSVQPGASGSLYQVGWNFRKLSRPECSVDLVRWLLISDDAALVNDLQARYAALLPDMARFAAEELEARIAKTHPVFQTIGRGAADLQDAEAKLGAAKSAILEKKWSEAGQTADEGIRIIRAAQRREWDETFSRDMLESGIRLADFYLLPKYARYFRLIRSGAWGENQLENGGFETAQGWGRLKLAHKTKGKYAIVEGAGRNKSRALQLVSDSPTVYQGKAVDWVTADVVSGKYRTKRGDFWELTGWVRTRQGFKQTERGLTLALYAYTAEGKRIPGFGAQALEATFTGMAREWKRLRLVVPIGDAPAASVAVRIAICGVGKVFVDDVKLRKLKTGTN